MMNRLVLFLCFLTVIIAQEINFGYYPLKSHPNLIEIANELKNYIEKNSLLKLNLIIPKDQKTFIDDLKNNKYDFIFGKFSSLPLYLYNNCKILLSYALSCNFIYRYF